MISRTVEVKENIWCVVASCIVWERARDFPKPLAVDFRTSTSWVGVVVLPKNSKKVHSCIIVTWIVIRGVSSFGYYAESVFWTGYVNYICSGLVHNFLLTVVVRGGKVFLESRSF